MIGTLLLFLALLQLKHWFIDFVDQTDAEVRCKGIYGNWTGMYHSVKHGGATFLILFLFFENEVSGMWAFVLGFLDFLTHYHIDWAKMNWGNRDIKTKQFWAHLGADQMAHQLTYIGLAYLITI